MNSIEIKARCKDQELVRHILKSNGAIFKGLDHQVDIYFQSPLGRLKLRKGNIENNLIWYERENKSGPKESKIELYQPTTTIAALEIILENSMGVKATVDKKREIYFIDNVKFHIDEVLSLGSFVEIEALNVNNDLTQAYLQQQCAYYQNLLNIQQKDLLTNSYSDMFMANK